MTADHRDKITAVNRGAFSPSFLQRVSHSFPHSVSFIVTLFVFWFPEIVFLGLIFHSQGCLSVCACLFVGMWLFLKGTF